jgi:hypothetical protein
MQGVEEEEEPEPIEVKDRAAVALLDQGKAAGRNSRLEGVTVLSCHLTLRGKTAIARPKALDLILIP